MRKRGASLSITPGSGAQLESRSIHYPECVINISLLCCIALPSVYVFLSVVKGMKIIGYKTWPLSVTRVLPQQLLLKRGARDFPGGLVGKTPCSQCRGPGFNP